MHNPYPSAIYQPKGGNTLVNEPFTGAYPEMGYSLAYEMTADGRQTPNGGNTAIFRIFPDGMVQPVVVTKPEQDATFNVEVLQGAGRMILASADGKLDDVSLTPGKKITIRPGDAYCYYNPGGSDLLLRDEAVPAFNEGDEVDLLTPSALRTDEEPEEEKFMHIIKHEDGSRTVVHVPKAFTHLVAKAALRHTKTERQRKFQRDQIIIDDVNVIKRAAEVKPGAYEVVEGSDEPVTYRPNKLFMVEPSAETRQHLPGVHVRGHWTSWEGQRLPVVSFLYHKENAEGQLETNERIIILTGTGYGEHPGHQGQPAAWYLVGAEIGKLDPETGEIELQDIAENTKVAPKNFSVDCITDGPFGEPILANPQV